MRPTKFFNFEMPSGLNIHHNHLKAIPIVKIQKFTCEDWMFLMFQLDFRNSLINFSCESKFVQVAGCKTYHIDCEPKLFFQK